MGFYDNQPIKKMSGGGAKPNPGFYPEMLVHKAFINPGYHGEYFVVELEVLDNGGDPSLTPAGSKVSWTTKLGGQYGYGESESTDFIAKCLGLTFEEVANSAEIRKGALLENKCQGAVLASMVSKKPTANASITKQTWELVRAPTAESKAQAAASMTAPTPPAPPAPAPVAAGLTEEQVRAAGWVPNTADPSGVWWYLAANPSAPQKTISDLKAGL